MDARQFARKAEAYAGRKFDSITQVPDAYSVLFDQREGSRSFYAQVCIAPSKVSDTTTFHTGEVSARTMQAAENGRLELTMGSFILSVAQDGSDFRINDMHPQPRFVD